MICSLLIQPLIKQSTWYNCPNRTSIVNDCVKDKPKKWSGFITTEKTLICFHADNNNEVIKDIMKTSKSNFLVCNNLEISLMKGSWFVVCILYVPIWPYQLAFGAQMFFFFEIIGGKDHFISSSACRSLIHHQPFFFPICCLCSWQCFSPTHLSQSEQGSTVCVCVPLNLVSSRTLREQLRMCSYW